VSEAAATPMPRRGRIWVILVLVLGLFALGYAIVDISTQKPGREVVDVEGITNAQETFGGVPQEGDRVGSDDAPVAIQYFADMQCGNCRSDFLETIPALVTDYARPGDVKLLMRHYSVAENPTELGFYGAEAAAEQGYGWQYTYLFFRHQDEAKRLGIDDEFMASLAGAIGELNVPEWEKSLSREEKGGGPVAERLESYEQLGTDLGMRANIGAVITGPDGTETLQDGPSLAEFESAIEAVGG
jgi:protein-disulfide isomerase